MTLLPEDEFDIMRNLARCRVCANSTYVKLSNARAHAQSIKHQSKVNKTIQTLTPIKATSNYPEGEIMVNNDYDIPVDLDADVLVPPSVPEVSLLFQKADDQFNSLLEDFENLGIPLVPPQVEMAPDTGVSPWSFENEGHQREDTLVEPPAVKKTFLQSKGDWAPYPTKAMFLTDILFNSPRLRFSEAQKKAILQWGKDLGAVDVPKFHTLKMFQNELNRTMGNPTTEKKTRNGNIFYLNEIGMSIAKDFSNPYVRPHMNFYPERCNIVSQMWHASKWHSDISKEYRMPMVIHPNTGAHFYVDELCSTIDNRLLIPKRWFQVERNNVWCAGFDVTATEFGLVVHRDSEVELPVAALQYNYLELTRTWQPIFADCSRDVMISMPHPKRVKAKGRPFFFVYVMIFIDDVSGNVSKQWNKHYVCYMSNAMLPREHLDKEYNVRFVTSSPSVTALELAQGVRESFEKSQEGTVAYDCVFKEEIMIETIPFLIAADNPMHAELSSCCGLTSNKFCRTCNVGGTQAFKHSDEGYLSLFQPGTLRTSPDTRNAIMQQFLRALQPNSRTALENLVKESGVKDTLAQPLIESLMDLSYSLYGTDSCAPEEIQEKLNAELRNLKQQGRIQNAFLEMKELDVHLDTPTEILHTILLGIVKYFWGQTVYLVIKDKKFDIFQARLHSVSSDGLSIPQIMASYLCQYRGGLIGKHFKTIVQIMPSIIYDLVHQDLLDAWVLMGRLTVLCWHTEIADMDLYLEELQDVIEQFLTKTAVCAPSIIVSKPKFHFLIHLPLYICRFGPALLFATERFESFNSVFRSSSVHSNHLAPSRDISITFSQLDRVKHITSGGWWYDEGLRKYVCASPHVPNFIAHHTEYARLIGLHSSPTKEPGTMISETQQVRAGPNERVFVSYHDTLAAHVQRNHSSSLLSNSTVLRGISVITSNGDLAKTGSAVIFKQRDHGVAVALVREIFRDINTQQHKESLPFLTVQIFKLAPKRHNLFDLPLLEKTDEHCLINALDLICVVNIQHDCAGFNCPVTGNKVIYQERQQTTRTQKIVWHQDDRNFVLNSLALHNHREIQLLLSQVNLPVRQYYESNSSTLHNIIRKERAASLRDKKQQAKEAKNSKEREIVLGRAERGSASQNTAGESAGASEMVNEHTAASSSCLHTEPATMNISGCGFPDLSGSVNNGLPPAIPIQVMESTVSATLQPPPRKTKPRKSKKTAEPSGAHKKTVATRSRKKQEIIGLGAPTGSAISQVRKRGKTKLTKEQIAANEEMLSKDIFDVE